MDATGTILAAAGSLVLAAALIAAVVVWAGRRNRSRGKRADRRRGADLFLDSDVADVSAAMDEIAREHGANVSVLVQARLRPLLARGVPVRSIRATGGAGPARICFADGTVIWARGARRGDLLDLLVQVQRRPVRLVDVQPEADLTRVDFVVGDDPRRVRAYAVGLDQPG